MPNKARKMGNWYDSKVNISSDCRKGLHLSCMESCACKCHNRKKAMDKEAEA